MPVIYCTVTNDLSFDQRMDRICTSLAAHGYSVVLVGRHLPHSLALNEKNYGQERLHCFFKKGFLFYAEFNIRLLFFLLGRKMDAVVAIDLDTILPCLLVSKWKGIKRVYDAHELFCEMKEVASRPSRYRFWKWVERTALPRFRYGYTVNEPIAAEFHKMYGTRYAVIKNVPLLKPLPEVTPVEKYLLYQGAVNEGRCFETLIPAMLQVDCQLLVCGDGNFMQQAKALVKHWQLEDKIIFKGMLPPSNLATITAEAYAGINLIENDSRSNYLSLANKFFDYIQAGIPQVCSGYPAYRSVNDQYPVAELVNEPSPDNIAAALNLLLEDAVYYEKLKAACLQARQQYNWQTEEKLLIQFYETLFG